MTNIIKKKDKHILMLIYEASQFEYKYQFFLFVFQLRPFEFKCGLNNPE